MSGIAEEAVACTFYWNNPRATEEFFEWVRARDNGRMWTFALLDSLWSQFQTGNAIHRLGQQDEPTREDVMAAAENMSNEARQNLSRGPEVAQPEAVKLSVGLLTNLRQRFGKPGQATSDRISGLDSE